jgi:hypothetical protein
LPGDKTMPETPDSASSKRPATRASKGSAKKGVWAPVASLPSRLQRARQDRARAPLYTLNPWVGEKLFNPKKARFRKAVVKIVTMLLHKRGDETSEIPTAASQDLA